MKGFSIANSTVATISLGLLVASFISLFFASTVYAHEAYVLTEEQFTAGSESASFAVFEALENPENVWIAAGVTIAVLAVIVAHFIFRETRFGHKVEHQFERFSSFGHLALRVAIAVALFYSALTGGFLGPEISLETLPYGGVIQSALFVISFMILVGFLTELAALIALIIYTISFFTYGTYMITYLSYLGEILALLIFGLRTASLDRLIFGDIERFKGLEKYRPVIVRVFYGAALAFAAINIKFLHPDLTLMVVNEYNLTQFGFLFPSDPLLVVLGVGLAELAIGIFILIGFELRLTILASLVVITMSLFFFQESVWPHLILYGVSLYLLFSRETLTLDNLLFGKREFLFDRSNKLKGEVLDGGIVKKAHQ